MVFSSDEMKEHFESQILGRLKLLYGIKTGDVEIIDIYKGEGSNEPDFRIVLIDSSQNEKCVRVFEIV